MATSTLRTLRSVCPLDCPDACSLAVTVDGDRVVKLDGTHENPFTEGYICGKVRGFPDHVHGAERLRAPAVRNGAKGQGSFRDVSWDEALSLIASRFADIKSRFGGEAILPFSYGGSNGLLSQDTTDARLFSRLGASRLARTVCAAPSAAAAKGLYGLKAGAALTDLAHSKLIVLWGANPHASNIHLAALLQKAIKSGARLIVMDPRLTPMAQQAALHLPVRPGTDLPVALSMIRWFFASGRADLGFLTRHSTGWEELRRRAEPWSFARAAHVSGVEPGLIEKAAQLYAEAAPAAIRCGWGPERSRCGGSATAAILALPAVAGKLGVRGGGWTLSNSGIWDLSSRAAARADEPPTREINMNLLGEQLLHGEPPLRALFVYNSNVLSTNPAQGKVAAGLAREDLFTVVFDQVLTDTARYADVVLPATTFLERRELSRSYGTYVLHAADRVIPPVGQARSNHDVFEELCRRMDLAQPGDPETIEEIEAAVISSSASRGMLVEQLTRDGQAAPHQGSAPVQMVDLMPGHPDGKIHLCPESLDREAPGGLYHYVEDPATQTYPLALISPSSSRTISSTLGQLHRRQVALEMHPVDAAARGIRGGEPVRVFNDLGEVRCHAAISTAMRPGVAFLPKGIWSHNTLNGATACALAPDTLTDLGGGACFNDARVQVELA